MSAWVNALEHPKFNVYFFCVCSAAHIVRLITGSTSPYTSAILFIFEYGLISSFIKTEESTEYTWKEFLNDYRKEIVGVANWLVPDSITNGYSGDDSDSGGGSSGGGSSNAAEDNSDSDSEVDCDIASDLK